MKTHAPRILGGLVVAVIILVYALTFVVREGEGAVVETLGKATSVLRSPQDAGVHLAWPWPIQKVHRYDLRQRLTEGDLLEISTADGQLLVAGAFVLWRIDDPLAFQKAVGGNASRVEELIAGPLRNGMNAAFGRHRFAEIVNAEEAAAGPATLRAIEREILTAVASEGTRLGIAIDELGFHQLVLPAQATEAVFEQMRDAKEGDAARLEAMGKAMAEKIKAEAELEYQQELEKAKAAATETIAAAHAEAAKKLGSVANPEVLVFLDKVDALKELMGGKTTLVLDPTVSPFDLLAAPARDGGQEPAPGPGGETR
jgi:modulator of FtsH protease HflC